MEQILDEARKAREALLNPEKEKKGKKGKKDKKDKDKDKKDKDDFAFKMPKDDKDGLMFKRRKAGKLPLDWPYKMGSKFLLSCIAYLSKDPDEDYNSRASEYFDVQSMAVLQQICEYMDMSLPDPERPTQYGETIVIMALNLCDWIAKYVIAPAKAIPDEKVDELLELRGAKPVPPKQPKKGKVPEQKSPDPSTEIQRNWNEYKSPVYVPEKSRISKRKTDEENVDLVTGIEYETESGVPRWTDQTLDDVKNEFLEYMNWYNPWEPEFMYSGPRLIPEGVKMYKIWDPDTDDVPDDLRVLNWNQIDYGFTAGYSFIPSPVPVYYPCLRPLRPVRLEEVERSGVPREVIKKSLRFFSPWYLMKKPLKPPSSTPATPVTPDQTETEFQGEYEVDVALDEEDMLLEDKPPPVKDSPWGGHTMKEQIQILGHIIHCMSSIPDFTFEYLFELLEEFCQAVACAEMDENPSPENRLLQKKRTIILEQYYFAFFGKKFRDYNDRTPFFMRVICSRCAYYIQILYEYTARVLWELQSRPNLPTPIPTPPETPDDQEALQNWDEWLAWLMKVTKTCDEWAGWISETVNEAEVKAAKKKREYVSPQGKKMVLTADEWYAWKDQVEKKVCEYKIVKKQIFEESPYYLEKAKDILPVKHRKVVCFREEEAEDEGEAEEDEEEGETEWNPPPGGTEGETEWEDVGEN